MSSVKFYEAYDVLEGKLAMSSNEKGHARSKTERQVRKEDEPNKKPLGRAKDTKGSRTEPAPTFQAGNRTKEVPPDPAHLDQARWKTKFCMFHLQGVCKYSTKCTFAHSMEELHRSRRTPSRFTPQVGCENGTAPFSSPPNQAPAYGAPAQPVRSGKAEQANVVATQETANTHAQVNSAWLKLQEPMFVEPSVQPAQGEYTFHDASAPEQHGLHLMDRGRNVLAPYGLIDYCPAPCPFTDPLWTVL